MVETLQDYMCKFMQEQTESFKGCLVAAFDNEQHYLAILDENLGSPVPSQYLKFCEVLASAKLFREEFKITRDGHNRYKVFYLTELGMEMAKRIKVEGFSGPVPQNAPIDTLQYLKS